MRTSVRTPDAGTVEEVLKLAGRAPSFDIVPPWRWRNGNECLELVTARADQSALLACGAVLHHVRVALSAMGWDCHVLRTPQPDGQVASVHPRWELDPFSCEVASAAAISLRPELGEVLKSGPAFGALGGVVSGSGPTVAFLVEDVEAAIDLTVALTATGAAREVRKAVGPVHGAHVIPARVD